MGERKDYSFSGIDTTATITHRPLSESSDQTLPKVGTSEALVAPSKDSWGRRVEAVSILLVSVLRKHLNKHMLNIHMLNIHGMSGPHREQNLLTELHVHENHFDIASHH